MSVWSPYYTYRIHLRVIIIDGISMFTYHMSPHSIIPYGLLCCRHACLDLCRHCHLLLCPIIMDPLVETIVH